MISIGEINQIHRKLREITVIGVLKSIQKGQVRTIMDSSYNDKEETNEPVKILYVNNQ